MERPQRPAGVTLLALLALISGIAGMLTWLAMLTGITGPGGANTAPVGGVFMWWLIRVVVSVLQLAFAYGAWTLKPWGWLLGVVLQAISLVLALVYVIGGSTFFAQAIGTAINVIILYYLFRPEVRNAFRTT